LCRVGRPGVQDFSYLRRQRQRRDRLLKERHARRENAVGHGRCRLDPLVLGVLALGAYDHNPEQPLQQIVAGAVVDSVYQTLRVAN
jgi:hypothetical protein